MRYFCNPSSRRYSDADPKNSSRISNSNRCLRPLQALTPGCFKSKADSFPRTSTPLNRRTPGPRPQFITPYRKQEANSKVSPLARCSSSRLSVSDSLEGQESGVMEPSSKKPRITVSNNTLNKVSLTHVCMSLTITTPGPDSRRSPTVSLEIVTLTSIIRTLICVHLVSVF